MVKTPEMAHKTLWMLKIAYNLTKHQMQQAAIEAGKPLNEMSFKGTVDLITSSHESLRPLREKPRKLAESWVQSSRSVRQNSSIYEREDKNPEPSSRDRKSISI